MARSSAQQIVLYDDSCPLCTFQMRALTWLDSTDISLEAPD